jgi:flagellar hook assembly protein FlgD
LPKRSFGGVVNIPYFFLTYTIGTGVTLTISPGVVCKFWQTGSITVNNGLIAEGLATNAGNIVFTSIYDDFHGGDSNSDGTATPSTYYPWQGIIINDVALDPQTRFANCIFRYASYSSNSAGIRTINASPSILNCSFSNDYSGVYASGASNPTINYCDFYNITNYAVNNVNQSFVINAENCWWGSNTGPTHSGNPGGIGEPVTNSVDYLPFGTSGTINPLMGDVSLNGIIQAYDASLVLQHVLVPFLNAKQQVVADVSGAAGITALDASLILQYVVGLISYFPAELLSPLPPYTSEAGLAIGNYTAIPGEEFDLPLQMTNVDGVFAGQITLNYDPEYLDAIEIINQMAEMTLLSDIDEINGIIRISFAGIEALESDLTIANIHFKAKENAPSLTIPIEGKFFMANESNLTGNITNGSVTINGFATGMDNNIAGKDNMLICYPNPVTDELTIDYTVEKEGDNVFIAVYDLFGQMVAEIANGKHAADSYKITWNCNGQNGMKLLNGTYLIRMVSGNKTIVQKIQIVK